MNHAIMKGCLFLVATSVRFRTGRTDLDGMTNLGRSMPVTLGAFSVVALSMVGVPPLAGFFSKLYLAQAGIGEGNWLVALVVLASSLLTAAYLFRVVERAYLGNEHDSAALHHDMPAYGSTVGAAAATPAPREAPLDMLLPTVLLAAAALGVGVANAAILAYVLEPGLLAWTNP
jgi:multicomponent Na+:H+ antiporter subunit D